jgi:hypothetical protein
MLRRKNMLVAGSRVPAHIKEGSTAAGSLFRWLYGALSLPGAFLNTLGSAGLLPVFLAIGARLPAAEPEVPVLTMKNGAAVTSGPALSLHCQPLRT